MPSVNVPGVGKVNFPDSMSQADIINAIERDILPNVKKEVAPPPVDAGFSLKDTALALSQGVVGSVKSIADAFGAENVVSSQLGAVQKTLGEAYTPERKAEMARRETLQQQAAKTGKDEISTFLAGVAEAPVQALAQGLGSIVPYVGTGIVGAIGKLAAPTVRAVNTAVGAVQGAGAVKGSLYDNVKNELVKSGISEKEADKQARQAQEYLGANFLDIMGGVALGGAAARVGVENLLTPGAAAKLNASLLPRMGKAALAEAPLEGAQAGQEQLAINRALQKQGFEVGTFEGVLGAAARDAAVGALVGSAVGAVRGPDAPTKTISDETKSKELKDQEAAFQNLPPPPPTMSDAEFQSLLNPVINESGELLQKDIAPPPAPPVDTGETFDMPTLQEEIAALKEDNAKRKANIDAGKTFPRRVAKYNETEAKIKELEAKLAKGGQDATKPIDRATTGDGAQVLSGSEAGGAPAGITLDGRPGVVDTTSAVSPIEDRAGTQLSPLTPGISFFEWAKRSNINVPEGPIYAFPELVKRWGAETNQSQEVINELVGEEVVDEQAQVQTQAAEQARLAEEQRLAAEQQAALEAEQAAITEEAVYEVVDAGLVKPEMPGAVKLGQILTQDEYDAANEEFGEGAFSVEQITPEVTVPKAITPTKAPVIESDQDASTPAAQTKRDEVVSKVNAFEDIRKLLESREKDKKTGKDKPGTGIESFDKKVKVAGPKGKVIKEVKIAKPIKWKGKKGTETANPSPYNFLNKNSYYSDKSPEQIAKQSNIIAAKDKKATVKNAIEAGVESAAFDEAYDLYDSIAYEEKVLPEIKQVMAQRQTAKNAEIDALNKERDTNREAKRAQMTRDGKSAKIIKEALSVIKNAPKVIYLETKPLEFMSEQEVLDLFKKNVGTKTNLEEDEGGQARVDLAKDRTAFVDVLSPNDKIKFSMMAEAILDMEIISAVQDNKVTTAGDRRTEKYRKKQEAKVINEVEQQLKEAEITAEKIERKAVRIAARAEEKKQERAQVTKEVETEEAEAKSKLVVRIEKSIVEGSLDTVLEVIADKKKEVNESTTRNIAQSFIDLVSDFGNITIQFGKVSNKNADGEFDPKTNTITIKGENGVYTGERSLDETVLHETGHYLTDHIFDSKENQKAYLDGIKDPAKRKAAQDAINRLNNNYRLVKSKLGNKFNIPTIKEFIAEIYSNPRFQEAVAALDTGRLGIDYKKFVETKPETETKEAEGYVIGTNREISGPVKQYVPAKESLFQKIVRNIAGVLGFNIKEKEGFVNDPVRGVTLKQTIEDIARIISLPTADIRSTEVSYLKKVGDDLRTDGQIFLKNYKNSAYGVKDEYKPKDLNYIKNLFFTKQGWKRIATALQNERYAIKVWEDTLALAKRIEYEGKDKINNIYGQLSLSVSRAKNIFYDTVQETYEAVNNGVIKLSNELGIDSKDTLDSLHRIMEALHDPERRMVKYILSVPLSTVKDIPQNGVMISAADRRDQIIKILNTRTITEDQAKDLRKQLNDIIFTTDANGNQIPNPKYVTLAGSSPGAKRDSIDPNNEIYNATGLSPAAAAERKNEYDNLDPKIKALIDEIIVNQQKLHKITTGLNQSANYWSQPVSNRVAFYGFNNYVPLKGIDKHSEADEMMDFDGEKLGKELQEVAYGFDGRMSVSDNPVLQSLSDAVRAAMRAGRVDLTQAIKNSVNANKFNPKGQGLLEGEVLRNITFEERQDKSVLDALPKDNTIFHYNPDGSIDVIVIRDKAKREAIRRTYTDTNTLTNLANQITSGLGMMHTRYNYNFAPLNFVRDALTNAWTLGAEMGPQEAARFIGQITNKVVIGNSLRKGMKLAQLYETKDFGKIRELAKKDPIYKEMVEFIEEGGLVSYLQGISLKSTAQQLFKEVGRSGIMTKVDQLNRVIDIWTNMFELSSRSAAYAIAKQNFKARDKTLTEEGARTKAAAYAKNLANFEQVGKYGKEMGAAFMFFRPAATGAVRAIESVAPAFSKLNKAIDTLPNEGAFAYEQVKGGPRVYKDPQAIAEFKANYAFQQKSARYMITALMGAGAFAYAMALMMADEDDLGRNKVMNDDMNQWSRFWRIYIPGFETPLQLPWGFGNGAFLAAGSQFAGVISGHQSMGKAFQNIVTQISLDSFVPIPVSRMDATDNPGAWLVDSLTPSMFRPIVEFVMNKNGLGQDIYNDSNRRMGDAYLGGDNIPEIYKLMAANLFKRSDGSIDISPNTLYFLANSYIDGPARVIDSLVNAGYLVAGTKEYKAKTDLPFLGSFIGSVPNVDSREFKKFEKEIIEKQQRLNMTKNDPETYYRILDKDPLAEVVIEIYNKSSGKLNKLRQESNEIRRSQDYTPKEKTVLLKENTLEQNIIKYFLIEDFKAYGIKP